MTDEQQSPIIPGQVARDQVILPNSVAFGICMRGIKARLGRSVVTLMGVAFGIAFLMSILAGFHIKSGMSSHAQTQLQIERYAKVLQGEVGLLAGKTFHAVVGPALSDAERGFLADLAAREEATVQTASTGLAKRVPGVVRVAPDAAAEAQVVLGLGAYGEALGEDGRQALAGQRLIVFDPPAAALAEALADAGVAVRHLGLELREEEKERAAQREKEQRARTVMILVISLLITVIGITNAMLMSVTERFREIGTMKCLGSLSSFVVKLFLIESSIIGFVGSLIGVLLGAVFPLIAYGAQFGFGALFSTVVFDAASLGMLLLYALGCVVVGVILSIIAGIYPARVAAKMIPAVALSSHI
jgi:hypothetical protein